MPGDRGGGVGEGKWDIVFNLKGKKKFSTTFSGKRCEGSGCERWNKEGQRILSVGLLRPHMLMLVFNKRRPGLCSL